MRKVSKARVITMPSSLEGLFPDLIEDTHRGTNINLRLQLAEKDAEIERLQDLLFALGEMHKPPCFVCGYNGQNYYSPSVHPCAKRHHALSKRKSV